MRLPWIVAGCFFAVANLAMAQAGDAPIPGPHTQPPAHPAQAQSQPAAAEPAGPQPIHPANALEHTFVAALTNPAMRPIFRRQLLESQVALALEAPGPEGELRLVPIQNDRQAAAIFTSPARLQAILGADAPYAMLTGRAALARARAGNAAINFMWVPMLTLEPADIEEWLQAPETTQAPRGPSQ